LTKGCKDLGGTYIWVVIRAQADQML